MPQSAVPWWHERLQKVVDPQIMMAPKLDWNLVDFRSINYLLRVVAHAPWVSQLTFAALVMSAHSKLDASTVYQRLSRVHRGWENTFILNELRGFDEWDPEEHLSWYMSDTTLSLSAHSRYSMLTSYLSICYHIQSYLHSLPPTEQRRYERWAPPPLRPELARQLSNRSEVAEAQQAQRQKESDAVTPHYHKIRGEAHFRLNALSRLRELYQQVIARAESDKAELPIEFSYEEPRWGRLSFLLWDRYSFIKKHHKHYAPKTLLEYERQRRSSTHMPHHYFLEFLGADSLSDPSIPRDPTTLLWFGDLLKENLLGHSPRSVNLEKRKQRQAYLNSWGYDTESARVGVIPFSAHIPGVLQWPVEQAPFMHHAQKRTDGLLFLVEPLFVAATFGLAALDVLTTTGARINELLQINLSPECLHTMVVGGKERLILKMLPKMKDEVGEY